MHKPTVIWDLDGTLLDSYGCIVASLLQFYREHGVCCDEASVHAQVTLGSVREFARVMQAKTGVSLEGGMARYQQIRASQEQNLPLTEHAREVLAALQKRGVQSFVITHRGASTQAVLERTGLSDAFVEVICAQSGFARKPAPDAIDALVRRYGLARCDVYCVGDRQLDMEFAKNAGVRGVLFRPAGSLVPVTGQEHAVIDDLMELFSLPAFAD